MYRCVQMKKILFNLAFSLIFMTSAFAFTPENFPDSFSIKNNPQCEYGCVGLFEKNYSIGSMKLASNKLGVFFLFDAKGRHLVTLRTKNISFLATLTQFDILDRHNEKIGKVNISRNHKSGQLLFFEIYAADGETPIIKGFSNLFGTKHTIYLRNTKHILAEITRPLFTFSRDSEVQILDKQTLLAEIDPNAFAVVLSFYCSKYIIHVDETDKIDLPIEPSAFSKLDDLEVKLKQIIKTRGFTRDDLKAISQEQLQIAADLMNERYHQIYEDGQLSDEEKIVQFVNFWCDLILSNSYERAKEMAMLQFLVLRLTEIRLDAMFSDKRSFKMNH